jgi:hypothetical protein
MGQAVPTQHPAAGAPVVIPSNHNLLRALLAFAAIAIVGLTVAVVILANDGDEVTTSQAPPSVAADVLSPREIDPSGRVRYDGGPEEGTRGIVRSTPLFEARPFPAYPTPRPGGGPGEATREVAPPPSSIAASDGSAYSQLRAAGALPNSGSTERYDGGPEEGSRGIGR